MLYLLHIRIYSPARSGLSCTHLVDNDAINSSPAAERQLSIDAEMDADELHNGRSVRF
jgi:hypothetical protein